MGLQLVAQAWAEREVLADADVVLHVDARLDVLVVDVRIAVAPGIAARRPRVEVLEALERIGAEVVRRVVGVVDAAVDLEAGADRVNSANVVEVRLEIDRLPARAAGQLLAAGVELVQYLDRGAFEDRIRGGVRPAEGPRELMKKRRPSGPASWILTLLL